MRTEIVRMPVVLFGEVSVDDGGGSLARRAFFGAAAAAEMRQGGEKARAQPSHRPHAILFKHLSCQISRRRTVSTSVLSAPMIAFGRVKSA